MTIYLNIVEENHLRDMYLGVEVVVFSQTQFLLLPIEEISAETTQNNLVN
jgi:hypothetical protein